MLGESLTLLIYPRRWISCPAIEICHLLKSGFFY